MSVIDLDETSDFMPRFNNEGLIPCIIQSADDDQILMFAWMNEEALNKTIETKEAYYWSRSRNELWHKGATSGDIQKVLEIRTDCDQDCILLRVRVTSDASNACHTGRKSCFYREVTNDKLVFKD